MLARLPDLQGMHTPPFRAAVVSRIGAPHALQGSFITPSRANSQYSLHDEVRCRRQQADFIARDLASREEGPRTGDYLYADQVHDELGIMLGKRPRPNGTRSPKRASRQHLKTLV
ncbi:hypothetical protein [Pseudoxanthomonas winnipegensis]|uniref:hypothetical protein n=1 Tax=Pseudoxanthomonas winnipegensis TaxID=2480810 RepID=UPI00197E98CB|nr:hypothetical protein [Pseudoxanthomonas winnipegensis]